MSTKDTEGRSVEEQRRPDPDGESVEVCECEAPSEPAPDQAGSDQVSRKQKRSDILFYGFLVFMGLLMIGLVVGVICIFTGVGVGCTCSECVG